MRVTRGVVAGIDCLISEPDAADSTVETLICLHGIGGDEASFAPQSEGLSDQYRVIAWNMPGYRQSSPIGSLSFELLADSLAKFVDALDVDAVHIVGQSIGGMIAQEFFHSYPGYFNSAKVKSLLLVATTAAFGGRDDTFKKAFLEARLHPLDRGMTMQQVAEDAMPSIVGKDTAPHIISSAIDSMATLDAEVYREVLKCLVTFNRRTEWQSIDCPVCLVAGSEDTNAPAVTMKKMADKLPHAEYCEIKGAGHLVNFEYGVEFNSIARKFLSHLSEPAT